MTTVKTTVKYRSSNMQPSTKARYVNRWQAMHKAFPNITMEEWCTMQDISSSTFAKWLRDPKYNKELRQKSKAEAEAMRTQTEEAPPAAEPTLFDSVSNEDPKIAAESQTEGNEISIETEINPSSDSPMRGEDRGAILVFTCPDFRVEISKEIDQESLTRIISYLRNLPFPKEAIA